MDSIDCSSVERSRFRVPCVRVGATDIPIPVYAKPCDSGLDLRADLTWFARCGEFKRNGEPSLGPHARWLGVNAIRLDPGRRITIGCGFAFEVPPMTEFQVRPRSGRSRDEIDVAFGTVDAGFRGEIAMTVINSRETCLRIEHGERIAQAVLVPVLYADLSLVDALSPTERNTGGFGSTGVK